MAQMKAFPIDLPYDQHGMDLRDYFAAKAMAAIICSPIAGELEFEEVSSDAYRQADAMMKAREK